MKRTSTHGFTIVELLIVIVVIGILAAITVVAFNGVQDRAKFTRMQSDLKSMQKAIEIYHADNGTYPNTGGSHRYQRVSGDSFIPGLVPKYIGNLPEITDGPSGSGTNNTYIYQSNAAGTTYSLQRLYQPSIPAGEWSQVPAALKDGTYADRWGYKSS